MMIHFGKKHSMVRGSLDQGGRLVLPCSGTGARRQGEIQTDQFWNGAFVSHERTSKSPIKHTQVFYNNIYIYIIINIT